MGDWLESTRCTLKRIPGEIRGPCVVFKHFHSGAKGAPVLLCNTPGLPVLDVCAEGRYKLEPIGQKVSAIGLSDVAKCAVRRLEGRK